MMKFKNRSTRAKFKFKSKLRARVKFRAHGVCKSREPSVSAERSRNVSQARLCTQEVNLNY